MPQSRYICTKSYTHSHLYSTQAQSIHSSHPASMPFVLIFHVLTQKYILNLELSFVSYSAVTSSYSIVSIRSNIEIKVQVSWHTDTEKLVHYSVSTPALMRHPPSISPSYLHYSIYNFMCHKCLGQWRQ